MRAHAQTHSQAQRHTRTCHPSLAGMRERRVGERGKAQGRARACSPAAYAQRGGPVARLRAIAPRAPSLTTQRSRAPPHAHPRMPRTRAPTPSPSPQLPRRTWRRRQSGFDGVPPTPAHHRCCTDDPSTRASGSVSDEAADGSGARGAARRASTATPGATAAPAHTAKTQHRYRSTLKRPGRCMRASPTRQQRLARSPWRERGASRRCSTAARTADSQWRTSAPAAQGEPPPPRTHSIGAGAECWSQRESDRQQPARTHAHTCARPRILVHPCRRDSGGKRERCTMVCVCVRAWASVSPVAAGGERAARASCRGGGEAAGAPQIRGVRLTRPALRPTPTPCCTPLLRLVQQPCWQAVCTHPQRSSASRHVTGEGGRAHAAGVPGQQGVAERGRHAEVAPRHNTRCLACAPQQPWVRASHVQRGSEGEVEATEGGAGCRSKADARSAACAAHPHMAAQTPRPLHLGYRPPPLSSGCPAPHTPALRPHQPTGTHAAVCHAAGAAACA